MIARRLLNLLIKLGIYQKHYKITYTGDITSANKIYSSQHWSIRSALKNKYSKSFKILLLEARVKKMSELSLFTFYNSRHDVDNLFMLNKVMMDTIKGDYLPEDSSKYYKSTHTIFDSDLPKGTVEFNLVGK
jgi:hypothetical protein